MASRFSLEAIFKANDQFSSPLSKMTGKSKLFTNSLKKDFASAQRKAMEFNKNFISGIKTGVGVGLSIAAVGLGAAFKEGIQLASDLIEVQNVVDTTFGDSANTINQWSKTAITQFGLSELEAKRFNGTMGAMLKSSGLTGNAITKLSTDMVGLAGDFASFYNLNSEEAFMKIRSGISGETEPLKQLGINMSVANLEAFALSRGITKSFKAMTQAEQVMLRYNYLMSVSKDAQGDFNKTLATSWANQQRVLKTKFLQILASGMTKLIPMLINGGKWLNNLLDKIDTDKLANNIQKAVTAIVKFAKGLYLIFKIIKPFLPLILSLIAATILYNKIMLISAQISLLMKMRMNPIILLIAALILLIYLIIKNWSKMNKVQKALAIGLGILATAIGVLIGVQWALNIAMTANPIGAIIVGVFALISAIILLIIYYKQVITFTQKWWDILKGLLIPIGGLVSIVLVLVEAIRSVFENWNMVKEAFKTEGMIGGILALGKAILAGVLAPIQSLFELLAKIPGIGKAFAGITENVSNFRGGLLSGKSEAPITPSERSALIREEKISKGELTIKDTTGKADFTKKPTGNNFGIKLQHSGAF